MGLTEVQRAALFRGLEGRGWFWREEALYAPHETMWLLRSDPWMHGLGDFHQRMTARLGRIEEQRGWATDPEKTEASASDTRGLAAVLQDLIDRAV